MIDPQKDTGVAPTAEIAEHRALGRQVLGDETPWYSASQNVEDGVDDLSQRPSGLAPSRGRPWEKGCDNRPLCIRQVGFVSWLIATILPPGGRVPHGASIQASDTFLESPSARSLNPFLGQALKLPSPPPVARHPRSSRSSLLCGTNKMPVRAFLLRHTGH